MVGIFLVRFCSLRCLFSTKRCCKTDSFVFLLLQDSSLPLVAVTVADGVPLKVGVAELGGEGVDNEWTVVVDAAAAVGLCELACTVDSQSGKLGKLGQTHTRTHSHATSRD